MENFKLQKGDTIAIISPSSGLAGEAAFKERYEKGKNYLTSLGFKVKEMKNTLKGIAFNIDNPKKRAEDLMDAFLDKDVKVIFTTLGGDDSIRILKYLDKDIIKENKKIFMGYSDNTVLCLFLSNLNIPVIYGPCILCEFAENNGVPDYTTKYIKNILMEDCKELEITSAKEWTSEDLDWITENDTPRTFQKEKHGLEFLKTSTTTEIITSKLTGGCLETLISLLGTELLKDTLENKILFLETSELCIDPFFLESFLRNLAYAGILKNIKGILFGKPKHEKYYEEYKLSLKKVIYEEENLNIPIIYNLNFGHTVPNILLPYNSTIKINTKENKIMFI